MNDRPPFILGTPRSGSSLFYWLFLGYLEQTRRVEGRGEFFFAAQPIVDDGTGVPPFVGTSICSIMTPEQELEVCEERLQMLRKYHGRYFFKVFPNQASRSTLERLCEHYRPLYVERTNLWDQFLSLAISISSGIWSTRENLTLPQAKLEFVDCLAGLEGEVLAYRELKRSLPGGTVITYEDFVRDTDLERLFAKAGLLDPFDAGRIWMPGKQNEDAAWKLGRFKDPELLISRYRRSALNELYPLSEKQENQQLA